MTLNLEIVVEGIEAWEGGGRKWTVNMRQYYCR
jgi:hypothetical protein